MPNPIFIVGNPRSGTTLLRAVLSSHSRIQLCNEPDLWLALKSVGYGISDLFPPQRRPALLDALQRTRGCRRHLNTLPADHLQRFRDAPGDLSFRDVFEWLVPRPVDTEIWGVKSLPNLLYFAEILRLYPDALMIHIVRDPRAALLSTYRKRFGKPGHALPAFGRETIAFLAYESMRWQATMEHADRLRRTPQRESFIEIRYEQFVSEPESMLRGLCQRIGVTFEPGMLDAAHRKNDPTLSSENAAAHQRISQSIDASRAGGGEDLPGWANYVIDRCAGTTLRQRGYASEPRVSLIRRAIIDAGLTVYEKKMRRRLRAELQQKLDGAPASGTPPTSSPAELLSV